MSITRRTIFVSPPHLMRWLSPRRRKWYVVLLDLEPDFLDEKLLRLDLNIVFNPISVRRKKNVTENVIEEDYYIGSTGAEIFLEMDNGVVREYTPPQTLDVDYKNTTSHKRISKLELTPSIKSKSKQSDLEFSAGSVTFEANRERTFEAAFSGSERTLEPIFQHNVVRWLLAMPRGEKVVFDFIAGNLPLFGVCEFSSRVSGLVRVCPSDIRFFDNKKKPLRKRASIMMRYVLHKRGITIHGTKGIQVTFKEDQ